MNTSLHPCAPRPFIKWVGGKTQLLVQLRRLYPTRFGRYFEPFLGGGAVFFDLRPAFAVLNDINPELIAAYKNIRERPRQIIELLRKRQRIHDLSSVPRRQQLYYSLRESYNTSTLGSPDRTALLIFLNKTGYNGMYRENSSGRFNVPFGRYAAPTIYDETNLLAVAAALRCVTLTALPFDVATADAKKGDFVYLDPPYYPLNGTARFTSYSATGFHEAEQIRLREVFEDLTRRGCYVMLSNSRTPFIDRLYRRYRRHIVFANRAINCKANGRGPIDEYVIVNYTT